MLPHCTQTLVWRSTYHIKQSLGHFVDFGDFGDFGDVGDFGDFGDFGFNFSATVGGWAWLRRRFSFTLYKTQGFRLPCGLGAVSNAAAGRQSMPSSHYNMRLTSPEPLCNHLAGARTQPPTLGLGLKRAPRQILQVFEPFPPSGLPPASACVLSAMPRFSFGVLSLVACALAAEQQIFWVDDLISQGQAAWPRWTRARARERARLFVCLCVCVFHGEASWWLGESQGAGRGIQIFDRHKEGAKRLPGDL